MKGEETNTWSLSVDVEKLFGIIQYPFRDLKKKTLNKPQVEGNHLSVIKAICEKHIANIILCER